MPLDYSSVRRQYDLLYGAGVTKKSMPEWAAEMNSLTSSNIYDRGLHDGWWTRASNWADENVFHPVADVTTAPIGAAIGEAFGNETLGREVGRSLPRMLAETAPIAIPYVGPAITGALMGAHTYADTGSGKAALISGVAGAALPYAGRFGGGLAARAFGTAEEVATETSTGTLPFVGGWFAKESPFAFKAASLGGSQAAQVAVNELSMYGQAKVQGQEFDPLSPEFLATQIPFTVFDAVHGIRAKAPLAREVEAQRVAAPKPSPERVVTPSSPEQEAQREALFVRLQDVTNNPEASPEERAAALDAAIQGVTDTSTVIGLKRFGKMGEREPVTVTGWGKKLESTGAYKIVVDPERTDPNVKTEEHGNLFVNDKNVTVNPDGSFTFKTDPKNLRRNVDFPLKLEEARPDPNQPNLPVQKNGLHPDETRIFEKVGIKPPEIDPMLDPVKNPTGTMAAIVEIQRRNAPLKPIAQELEQVQGTLQGAKEKIATVPKSAEEVAQVVNPETAKPQIEQDIKDGHTPTQAVETARLTTHTPIVDTALEQQNVLKVKAEKVISTDLRGKPQAQYGEAVRDTTGENFKTRALAEAFRDADPELSEHVVRNAGSGKGYYLAPQINKEVSLEGTNLEAVLSDPTPVDSRPDVSIQDVVGVLDRAGANLDVFDELMGNDDIGQTLKEVQFTKKFLQKTLAGEKVTLDDEMRKVVLKVTKATGQWNSRFRSWDLESSVPHDEALVNQIGIREGGARAWLDWYVNHPKSGPLGEFVGSMLKTMDENGLSLANVDFVHDPQGGWAYYRGTNTERPKITYANLPSSENAAFDGAGKAAHEVAHFLGEGILSRADPQAVRFRSILNQVNEVLSQSKDVPLAVRKAVAQGKAEGWFDDHRDMQMSSDDLYSKFVKVAGEENKKWFGTFYGMQNEHELFASMFNNSDLVRLLAKTPMPKSFGQSVLQFFSQAWNRMFGGKPEQDNALHEILTKFEDYLSGPKIQSRMVELRPNLPAGEGFFYGMAPYDPQRNTLGGKHALPKSGIVSTNQFKSIGGVGKPLADAEIELYRSLVPEAFVSAGNVNVPKLVEGLKTKGPVVEVRKLGVGESGSDKAIAQHELETLGYRPIDLPNGTVELQTLGGGSVAESDMPKNVSDLFNRFLRAQRATDSDAQTNYSFVSPKPESEMPGYVEGLVRVPIKGTREEVNAYNQDRYGDTSTDMINQGRAPLYSGPHFGSEGTNVLSFYRGYEETLPDGTKAFHVIEVQSDWGQRVREESKDVNQRARDFAARHGGQPGPATTDHPLLRVYESLALKAAIAHAKEVGATKVILSDAETAMMTEGHDRQHAGVYRIEYTPENSDKIIKLYNSINPADLSQSRLERHAVHRALADLVQGQNADIPISDTALVNWFKEHDLVPKDLQRPALPQERGMRLHYDQTLPSAMEKLTGEKGERVEVGVHKNAIGQTARGWNTPNDATSGIPTGQLEGSPIFHDPSGNPKTQITGRLYDISKVLTEQTLFDNRLTSIQVKNPNIYNGRDYLRDALIAKGVRPEGLTSRIDSVEKLFSTGDLAASLEGFQREQTAGTLPATTEPGEISNGFTTALLQGVPTEVYQSAKNLLAHEVPVHEDLWARLRQDIATAQELRRNIEKGYVPGSVPEGLEEKLKQAFTKLNAMKNGLDKNAAAIERWGDLQNFTTEGFENTLASQLVQRRLPAPPDPTPNQDEARGLLGLTNEVAEVRRETALAELQGKPLAPGLLQRWVGLTQHVKKLFPAVRPVMDNVELQFNKQTEHNRALKLVYDGYNPETKEFDTAVRRRNIRIATTPALEKAASNMRRWGNIWEQAGEEWDYSRPEIRDILSKFNAKDRQALIDEANSGRARYHTWVNVIVPEKLSELNTASTAKVIAAHEVGMLPENARELSAKIYDALAAMQDPAQAVGGQEMLRQISTKMQPDTFLAALRYSQDMVTQANKDLELMRSRPSYAPEQRYDSDHLVMQGPQGQAFRAGGDRKKLLALQKEKEVQGYKFLDYIPKSTTDTPVGIRSDFLDAMRESDLLRQQRLEQALEKAPSDVAQMILADAQRTSQYEALSNAFKPLPRVTRNFVEGREYINMLHNEDEFYSRSLNWYRHQITRAETSLDMLHPEVAGNRTLKEYAQQHVDNALSADNPLFRKLIKTVYFQRLAFSLGNSILEGVQNLGTGMQAVIAETGSVTDAFKLWGQGVKNTTVKASRSPDMQWMFDRAEAMGLRRVTTFRDIHDPDSEGAYFILSKNPLVKGANLAQAGATKWATWFQRFNDDIGLAAGFQLAMDKGMSRDEALIYARDLKNRGFYTGGKAQRPVGLWSIKTKPVPQMLSALQTYTLGWFSQMATDWKIGFRGQGEGLSELQRSGSRKAFVYGLAAQATLAGALGLPGVGQGLALLKQATGLDLKGQLRASLASLFDEDQDSGGMLTNLALRGALAGFSPIDPSNRAAISFPFVGVDPYKGFDISQLLGAPGASVSDAVKGTLAMMKGDATGFQKLLPSVLKAPLQLIQGEGDVRDARGALLQTLTPAERFLTAIGLPSSRIQAARDTADAVKNLNTAAVAQKEHLVDDLAMTYRKLGPTQGQQKLAAYLQDHPTEDGPGLVRSVATRVRRQTLPYDYRRDLARGVDLHGLGSRLPSSETAGRQIEYDVQKNLGLLPRFNLRADVDAVSIDQLMDSNPYLSRSEAMHQVSEKSRVRRPSRVLNFQQPQSLFQ